jgi:ubiquinone/menaquinone biosynthesis C-methylase UbiE
MSQYTYHDFLANFGITGAHPGGLAFTIEILNSEKLSPTSEVLDVGCGTGQTSSYLKQKYDCQVSAIEKHPLMLKKSGNRFKKENLRIHLVEGTAEKIPFASDSFDIVIAESVTVFTSIPKALKEYARVLKPNGVLLNLDMTAESLLTTKDRLDIKALYGIKHVPSKNGWIKRFKNAGFHSIEIIKGGTVHSLLSYTPLDNVMVEMDPSPSIDPKMDEIGDRHLDLTEKHKDKLGYNFFRMKKTVP